MPWKPHVMKFLWREDPRQKRIWYMSTRLPKDACTFGHLFENYQLKHLFIYDVILVRWNSTIKSFVCVHKGYNKTTPGTFLIAYNRSFICGFLRRRCISSPICSSKIIWLSVCHFFQSRQKGVDFLGGKAHVYTKKNLIVFIIFKSYFSNNQ